MCGEDKRCCCCHQGPQGVPGLQGAQGVQGVPGQQGIPGQTGMQGAPGKDGKCDCATEYASVYSLLDQVILSGSAALLEKVSVVSAGFDLTSAAAMGQIKVLKHGIYAVNWGFNGLLQPPYPGPVPAWTLGIYKNATLVSGSTSGSFSITPDDLCSHNSGLEIFEIMAGDILTLVNTSTLSLMGTSTLLGSMVPVASARVNISLVQQLP